MMLGIPTNHSPISGPRTGMIAMTPIAILRTQCSLIRMRATQTNPVSAKEIANTIQVATDSCIYFVKRFDMGER